jgi:hypothetical protein
VDARCRLTSGIFADGEVAWSWRPDAGVKSVMMLSHRAGDGGKKAGHQGERDISVKTIRAGDAGLPPLHLYARVRFLMR